MLPQDNPQPLNQDSNKDHGNYPPLLAMEMTIVMAAQPRTDLQLEIFIRVAVFLVCYLELRR